MKAWLQMQVIMVITKAHENKRDAAPGQWMIVLRIKRYGLAL
jgi:hypothetical protein